MNLRPKLCVIEGDGIGPEVIGAALEVLHHVVDDLDVVFAHAGWGCFLETGTSVPEETLNHIRNCGAALFGAVSSPSRKVEGYRSAILTMRQELDLFANIRPSYQLPGVSPGKDVDLVVVRENTEGMYVGQETSDGERATALRVITREASARIARVALKLAQGSDKRLTVVHKANVLPLTCGLFRDTVRQVATEFPEVEVDELLVDIAALHLASNPQRFDVLVTTNLFGDILSDLAAHWMGGMGLAPSLNLGESIALAEPVHGSAPDIAGKGLANPSAAILSTALLLRHYWDRPAEADLLERSVCVALDRVGCSAGTDAILQAVLAEVKANQAVRS